MATPRYALFGGRIVPYGEAQVGVLTHALHYGTAVFAGLRGYWNDEKGELLVFRPADHFRRFLESARLLRMELPASAEALQASLGELLRAEAFEEDCYIRPLAFYRDETIGVRLHGLTPEVTMVAVPFGRYIERNDDCHVTVSGWRRVADDVLPARGKIAGSYVNSALAKSDAQLAGFDEAILLNREGHLCEGSAENVFVVRRGTVITPPVNADILEGITRATVMTLLREEMGLTVVERSIDLSELYLAEEAFLTGTGAEISLVTRADHRALGSGRPGPIGSALRRLYDDVVRGRNPRYRHWCWPAHVTARAARPAAAAAASG